MLAILCCECGKSPLAVSEKVQLRSQDITDWPDDLRITNYYNTDEEGPSVEFTR